MKYFYHLIIILMIANVTSAQNIGSLHGEVTDSLGEVIGGVEISLINAEGVTLTTFSDQQGKYIFSDLSAGFYTLQAKTVNFAVFEQTGVQIFAGRSTEVPVKLIVLIKPETVTVENQNRVGTEPDNNHSATVLKQSDLAAFSEDSEELAEELRTLAGTGAGPSGPDIYIDGFTGGRLPPRESIREVRINENPFSAEYDRVGFGRIEIFTKPGFNRLTGQAYFSFNNQSLNSRNPFSANRAPSRSLLYGGSISGPVKKNKSSFFTDVERRAVNDNAVINAAILNNNFEEILFNRAFVVPQYRFSISPRLDYAINDHHSLTTRYSFARNTGANQTIGNLVLPSLATQTANSEQTFQLTENSVLTNNMVNETRFQYTRRRSRNSGNNSIPTINVATAFIDGGAFVGSNFTNEDRLEIQNYSTLTIKKHTLRFGGRLRNVRLKDYSESNFNGTFTFGGRPPVFNAVGQVTAPALSSIDQYRLKVSGSNDPRANPNLLVLTAGDPLARVQQTDFGTFINDDYRISSSFTLNFGLRYEIQNNIKNGINFAPRVGAAYAFDEKGKSSPKTVIRAGFGIFYDRFSENLVLLATRFNGTRQKSYVVNDNDRVYGGIARQILAQPIFTLNGVSNVPSAAQLAEVFPNANAIQQVSGNLLAPRTFQGAVSLERQFPFSTTLSLTYLASRTLNLFRSRNINAPLPSTNFTSRPNPALGNVNEYESNGVLNQQQLLINFNTRLNPRFTIFTNYRLNRAKSDSDGAGNFPADSYSLAGEYGNAGLDLRHNLFLGASIGAPWGIQLNPLIVGFSSRPFNIITGIDSNSDGQFSERPAFATDLNRPSVVITKYGAFDLVPLPGQQVIPRNFGRSPAFFNVNLNLSKTFSFGGKRDLGSNSAGSTPKTVGQSGSKPGNPYSLTMYVLFQNLLNRNNRNIPIGNLSSSRFGESFATFGFSGGGSTSGNRRIQLQLRFNF